MRIKVICLHTELLNYFFGFDVCSFSIHVIMHAQQNYVSCQDITLLLSLLLLPAQQSLFAISALDGLLMIIFDKYMMHYKVNTML